MMFRLDDDERVITDTAAAFAAKRLAPHALEWDAANHFPIDALVVVQPKHHAAGPISSSG